MSTIPEIVPFSETISQPGQEGLGVGGEVIAKSETPEIGHSGETSQPGQEGLGGGGEVIAKSEMPEIGHSGETSQPGQEGLGGGGEVIAKSEMPEIGHSGETSQPGKEGLRVGRDVRMSKMPEIGQSDVETRQPIGSGSTSEMSLGAAFDCDLKVRANSKGQSSDAATQDPKGLDGMLTAGTKLQSVSETKSVEIELFEASKDSEWFDAIEKKNCKFLLELFRSDRSLWVQTGLKGRSVLHVAVMQGCSELVHELHCYKGDLVPCGENWQTPFEFLWENARDGRLKDASAQDLWLVMEGPSVKDRNNLFIFTLKPFVDRSRDDYVQSHAMWRMPVDSEDSEMLSLRGAISSIAIKENFVMDENDVDFNFENVERKELYVHMACSRLRNVHNEEDWNRLGCDHILEFIIAVLTDLCEKNLLQKLFDQKDAQGRTVLQVFVLCDPWRFNWENIDKCRKRTSMCRRAFGRLLAILPDACVNTPDTAGRTVLHWAVAHENTWAVAALLESGKARPNVTFRTAYIGDITPFHLIILYEHMLPAYYLKYLKYELKRKFFNFKLIDSKLNFHQHVRCPVAWAIQMGRNEFVKRVMETEEWQELYPPKDNKLLAVAAYSGVEILQHFLQKDDVDKLNVVCAPFPAPPLHLAVEAQPFWTNWPDSRTFDGWLHCNDFISIELLEKKLGEKDPEEDSAIANTKKSSLNSYGVPDRNQYSAKQACANLLLQAGADILATDKISRMADPGARAPNEAKIWWYELVAKETLNIKNDLNAAGTGTAVVATLVATASFVGPLQPPLNYVGMSSGTTTVDVGVQVTEALIKVFLVSNSLSFYLAITSIMLAIMPSLPIPKEGLVSGPCDDLKRSRRTISIAIGMLLASIISVLISFAASSLAVLPLQHRGLMAYSTSIGGLICCIGIFFFFLRFLRLICPQNTFIKKLYQKIGKL
ncbi:unnamed protein product [Sphagnum jensenii]|uniref:PGG domain-containing protein n=1 Tax=Sphagnum jensenii TaxID=128206 RepID=A0ABP1B5A8_9BRYO